MIELSGLLGRLTKVRKQAGYHIAACPAHADRNPSLSVKATDDAILVNCFAGCTFEDIARALSLDRSDFFADDERADQPQIDTVYPYTDLDGTVLYEVVRYWPKAFRQRRPTPDGHVWDLKGVDRVPYRWAELREAIEAGRWVFLVEGEKDADRLAEEGKVATTIAGGAKSWKTSMAEWFDGGLVAFLPDNDGPGHQFARQAAKDLTPRVRAVRIVRLPDLPAGGDVSNFLISHSIADVEAAVRATADWSEGAEIVETVDGWRIDWPDENASATVTRIRERDESISGEIDVQIGHRRLFRDRVNLASSRGLKTFTNGLTERAPETDWFGMLKDAADRIVDQWRQGSPLLSLADVTETEPGWLLEPLVESEGATVLFGPGGTGKGWVAIASALSVASGAPIFGTEPATVGPVAYLDWEASESDTKSRLARMARAFDVSDRGVYYRRETAALSTTAAELAQQFDRLGVVFAVVDSKGMASAGAPESAEHTIALFRAIRRLAVPCLVVDHSSKASMNGEGPNMAFGSVYTTNAARLAFRITSEWAPGRLAVDVANTKRNNGPRIPTRRVLFEFAEGLVRVEVDDAPPVAVVPSDGTLGDRIAGVLVNATVMHYGEIAERLGASPDSVRRTLNRDARFDTMSDRSGQWFVREPLPDPM